MSSITNRLDMYTQGKFPILEQHFEWYRPSLNIKALGDDSGGIIATIDMTTGNIQVSSVFEFLSYKVQLFVIYKLISLFSQEDIKDDIMLRLFKRLPHVAPDFFERLLITIKAKYSENNLDTRPEKVCLLFPGQHRARKNKFNRPSIHSKHNTL